MQLTLKHYRSFWSLLYAGSLWTCTPVVQAQISADGSLTTTVSSADGLHFTIDQGDRAGNILFHSFEQFLVPTNGAAIFNNATDITTIFSRVTGDNISTIEGLIQTNGTADLLLLNPRGIQFGAMLSCRWEDHFLLQQQNGLYLMTG